jgi:hypothetical protein
MKLIVMTSPEGKPLRARVRVTPEELKKYVESLALYVEDDEVIDMELDPTSEYQLLIGLEGKLDRWDNQATLEQIQSQVRS